MTPTEQAPATGAVELSDAAVMRLAAARLAEMAERDSVPVTEEQIQWCGQQQLLEQARDRRRALLQLAVLAALVLAVLVFLGPHVPSWPF